MTAGQGILHLVLPLFAIWSSSRASTRLSARWSYVAPSYVVLLLVAQYTLTSDCTYPNIEPLVEWSAYSLAAVATGSAAFVLLWARALMP